MRRRKDLAEEVVGGLADVGAKSNLNLNRASTSPSIPCQPSLKLPTHPLNTQNDTSEAMAHCDQLQPELPGHGNCLVLVLVKGKLRAVRTVSSPMKSISPVPQGN